MRLLFALALLLPAPLLAQAPDCTAPQTQTDMTQCAVLDWQAADADLNVAYGKAVQAMQALDRDLPAGEAGAEAALRAAQRAWIAFRDAACTAEGFTMRGGTAEPMVVAICKARLTAARTQDLLILTEQG